MVFKIRGFVVLFSDDDNFKIIHMITIYDINDGNIFKRYTSVQYFDK